MNPAFAFDVCHDIYVAAREALDGDLHATALGQREKYLWRPDLRPRLAEYVADFALAGQRALDAPALASRLALFRVFYLGRAPLHAARGHLGISELTWEQWSDDVRARVGREILRRRLFPPRDYFRDEAYAQKPKAARKAESAEECTANPGVRSGAPKRTIHTMRDGPPRAA